MVVGDLTPILEHSNRICQIHFTRLTFTTSPIEKVWAAMQVPFPELTALTLGSEYLPSETVPVLPDSFLGGSAPRLRLLTVTGIPFPRLQKLLSSATHFVELHLLRDPHSAYISPEEMATCLSVKDFPLNSNPLDLLLIKRTNVTPHLRQLALSSPYSWLLRSVVSTDIWSTFWPG